jgi:hypothetical protein
VCQAKAELSFNARIDNSCCEQAFYFVLPVR